jgi:hypothetical protein
VAAEYWVDERAPVPLCISQQLSFLHRLLAAFWVLSARGEEDVSTEEEGGRDGEKNCTSGGDSCKKGGGKV